MKRLDVSCSRDKVKGSVQGAMPKISVVIITKNEEPRIRKALASVRSFADEIVVVDDMSTDCTREIAAREFQAKVFQRPLEKDFAAQRNFGAQQASSAWIFPMDADEFISDAVGARIREAIGAAGDTAAFELRRLNYFVGSPIRHAGAYGYYVRLYRKDCVAYHGPVHEQLEVRGVVSRIDGDICHYPFETLAPFFDKAVRYAEQEAELYCQARPHVSAKEIRYHLTWRPLKTFWKIYVRKKGYRDGLPGLVWCVGNVIGPLIKWMKIWEKAERSGLLAP